MHVMGLLRRGAYADSIALMQIAEELRRLPGIATAALLMATPANLAALAEADLLPPEAEGAAAEDIVLAVRADDVASGRAALARAEALLARPAAGAPAHAEAPPRSLVSAARRTAGRQPRGDRRAGRARGGRGPPGALGGPPRVPVQRRRARRRGASRSSCAPGRGASS